MRRPMLLALSLVAVTCVWSSASEAENHLGMHLREPADRVESWSSAPGGAALEAHGSEILEEATAVPRGIFTSLAALCAAQRSLVREQVARASEELSELHGEPVARSPRCVASRLDPEKVDVKLRAPYLEVRALEIETGYATEVHVAARTAQGWQVAPAAALVAPHDDPGCATIERDTGIEAIRVEGARAPALVVTAGSDSFGVDVEEASPDAAAPYILWSEASKFVVACRLGPAPTCGERVVVRVERVPSDAAGGRATEVRFRTTYTVDAAGEIVPKERPAGARRVGGARLF